MEITLHYYFKLITLDSFPLLLYLVCNMFCSNNPYECSLRCICFQGGHQRKRGMNHCAMTLEMAA